MVKKQKRVIISVPEDIKAEVEQLKGSGSCGNSYAEVYRRAIRLGLDRLKEAPQNRDSAEAHL